MSGPSLERLAPCFQGLIPSTFYTCSAEGVPNVSYLSHVEYVDRRHVALSYQFFNKSRRNIAENPQAMVRVHDPDTWQCYRLHLRYVRSETAGPLFDSMALRIEAIASHSGLKGIFALRAADVYRVLKIEAQTDEIGVSPPPGRAPRNRFTVPALQELTRRLQRETRLERLLNAALAALDELYGFGHSMILLAQGRDDRLVTLASRGYPDNGVGAEVGFGEGIVGMVAEARKPIRIAGLLRDMLYAAAVRESAERHGLVGGERSIPLPGLPNPESQLGLPLLVGEELIGVLCVESEQPYRFHEEDRAYLEVVGGLLALAIQAAASRERIDELEESPGPAGRRRPERRPDVEPDRPFHRLVLYRADECILVDDQYLIRSLPAKILWKVLREHFSGGRVEFTNRELRLDKTLGLPDIRDNLESRLILLRRRLEQRCPAIRLSPCGRGRFHLELDGRIELDERD